MLKTQLTKAICCGFAVILLTSVNLVARTAPHLVAGTLENDEFITWLGLQNRSRKTCKVAVQYHKGAMKLPDKKLLTDGEDLGNAFLKHIPSHGSTSFEVSTAPGTDTIFTGSASFFFEDSVCLNEVGITAEFRVNPTSQDIINELFSYPVGPSIPLDNCAAARINFDPPFEIPGLATVSTGGAVLPAGTTRFMQLYDQDGVLVNSTLPSEYDGTYTARNLQEDFPRQGRVSGIWKVCTEKPDGFRGAAAIDAVFINVVNRGNVQLAATSNQQTNDDCKMDDTTLCLLNQQFKATLNLRGSPTGPSRRAKVGFTDGSLGTFVDEQAALKFGVSIQNGCSSDFPAYWVFAAATTDVQYTLTITDTATDSSKSYENPFGRPSPAITDTAAFLTCPD